MMCGGGGGRKR